MFVAWFLRSFFDITNLKRYIQKIYAHKNACKHYTTKIDDKNTQKNNSNYNKMVFIWIWILKYNKVAIQMDEWNQRGKNRPKQQPIQILNCKEKSEISKFIDATQPHTIIKWCYSKKKYSAWFGHCIHLNEIVVLDTYFFSQWHWNWIDLFL